MKIIEDYSRGGEYRLLFLKSEGKSIDPASLLWANAWLASDEHVAEIEASSDHLQGRYIQQGFHPGYGTNTEGPFYEPIYGGPLEPLVLGWSADHRHIDPELSQEFERCYKLTRVNENCRTVWNSWQEAIDEVAVLEKRQNKALTFVARADFLSDFQYLKKRWFLIGVYGEWGNRSRVAGGQHVWTIRHVPRAHKLYVFGVSSGFDFEYVEIQGYFLTPMPQEVQFSGDFSFGVPSGLRGTVESIEFQTSQGRIRPWDVRQGLRWEERASATAMFDQEVLCRYQSELGSKLYLDSIGGLQIESRKVHLGRIAMLLGTEYISVWMSDFVAGVPPSEWAHWQAFNRPFVGFDRQRELFEAKNLFRMTSQLIRLTKLVNNRWSRLCGDDEIPFYLRHNTEKDFHALTEALPRHADSQKLTDRAKALYGLTIEGIAGNRLRVFLKQVGFAPSQIEELGSIKLFSTFMMVARIAEAAEGWQGDLQAALSYAQRKVASWQIGAQADFSAEELGVINQTLQDFEIMFLVHDLRLLSAHPTTNQVEGEINRAFREHMGEEVDPSQFRGAILTLYDALSACLEKCRA